MSIQAHAGSINLDSRFKGRGQVNFYAPSFVPFQELPEGEAPCEVSFFFSLCVKYKPAFSPKYAHHKVPGGYYLGGKRKIKK